jgi:hypothetical protein
MFGLFVFPKVLSMVIASWTLIAVEFLGSAVRMKVLFLIDFIVAFTAAADHVPRGRVERRENDCGSIRVLARTGAAFCLSVRRR